MLGIRDTRLLLASGAVTAADHVAALLAAIANTDPRLHAFVAVAGPEALRAAGAADRLIRDRGRDAWTGRPLLGVPVAAAAPAAKVVLLSAPAAAGYYPHLGFRRHESAWVLDG